MPHPHPPTHTLENPEGIVAQCRGKCVCLVQHWTVVDVSNNNCMQSVTFLHHILQVTEAAELSGHWANTEGLR